MAYYYDEFNDDYPTRYPKSQIVGYNPDNKDLRSVWVDEWGGVRLGVLLNVLVLEGHTINSSGESDTYIIGGAKHVDVLIEVGTATGSPSLQFHLNVVNPFTGTIIRTYDGSTLTSSNSTDYITVDGLTLGTHINLSWDGTLDSSNYFDGVYVILIAKA